MRERASGSVSMHMFCVQVFCGSYISAFIHWFSFGCADVMCMSVAAVS